MATSKYKKILTKKLSSTVILLILLVMGVLAVVFNRFYLSPKAAMTADLNSGGSSKTPRCYTNAQCPKGFKCSGKGLEKKCVKVAAPADSCVNDSVCANRTDGKTKCNLTSKICVEPCAGLTGSALAKCQFEYISSKSKKPVTALQNTADECPVDDYCNGRIGNIDCDPVDDDRLIYCDMLYKCFRKGSYSCNDHFPNTRCIKRDGIPYCGIF